MLEQLAPLIAQAPYLVGFIWFALEMNKSQKEEHKQFLDALDKRDTAFEHRTKSLIEKMDANNRALSDSISNLSRDHREHDRYMREHFRIQSLAETDTDGSCN
jgi:hypothetical protein